MNGKRFVSFLSWTAKRNEREETGSMMQVLFTSEKVATGMGKTRKDAQQQVAKNALRSLADKYVACIISQAGTLNKHPDNQPTEMENGFLCETDSDEDGENSSGALLIHTLRIWPRLRMGFCGISVCSTYRSAPMAQNYKRCEEWYSLLQLQLQQEPFTSGSETQYTISVLSPQMLKHMHQMRDYANPPFSHLTDHE
ncbi:RNA polymerase II C-terminal domain phosphatase-like protein 2 isoform X2 [Tanacetum coccineum]